VEFVISSMDRMEGGEIFVPKIPSMNIMELARAIAPECRTEVVGIRPGEKLHEVMVPRGDGRSTIEFADRYVILHAFHDWNADAYTRLKGGDRCSEEFSYSSDANSRWLTTDELKAMLEPGQVAAAAEA
jgi:UDP-N-acetylglucosamine 4,6-dehydratase